MSPQRHVFSCFSGYPHVTSGQAKDWKDEFFQRLTYALKDNGKIVTKGQPTSPFWLIATKLGPRCEELTQNAVVVPVPRSSVTPADMGAEHWPALRIAEAFVKLNMVEAMRPALRRATPVAKARLSRGASRPTVQQHIDSLQVNLAQLEDVPHIVLVDDVMTRGTQMMGAMRALQLAGYAGTVSGFAAGHTDYGPRTIALRSTIRWEEGTSYPSHQAMRTSAAQV